MKKKIQRLEDIEVYKESLVLAKEVFDLCKNPSLKKEYSICEQIKRACVSVSANIAEGYGRLIRKDFSQFLSIALGSVNETVALLDIIGVNFSNIDIRALRSSYNILGKRIYAYRRRLLY